MAKNFRLTKFVTAEHALRAAPGKALLKLGAQLPTSFPRDELNKLYAGLVLSSSNNDDDDYTTRDGSMRYGYSTNDDDTTRNGSTRNSSARDGSKVISGRRSRMKQPANPANCDDICLVSDDEVECLGDDAVEILADERVQYSADNAVEVVNDDLNDEHHSDDAVEVIAEDVLEVTADDIVEVRTDDAVEITAEYVECVSDDEVEVLPEEDVVYVQSKDAPPLRTAAWCEACKGYFSSRDHSRSISHQLALNTSNLIFEKAVEPNFFLSSGNKGYQMMMKQGWDGKKGLGKDGKGCKYPVKTVVKADRAGFGSEKLVPRVTHTDVNNVAKRKDRTVAPGNTKKDPTVVLVNKKQRNVCIAQQKKKECEIAKSIYGFGSYLSNSSRR